VPVTDLADTVLPLIRSRADLHRRSAANAHGAQMHEAVDLLEQAVGTEDPATVYAVTHKALASAIKVVARADDSSGIIGDACRRLLALHPQAAAAAVVPPAGLVDWMMKFQFEGDVDFFTLDPIAYAPALGEKGIATYRARLEEVRARLGPQPDRRWSSPHSHAWFTLGWNDQRLAVLDHDIEAIIRTHAKDRKVAAWVEDTAEAFEEIGEIDLAIDWAKQATDFDDGHQSLHAADYWCRLLAEHRADELLDARVEVFRRWPSSTTAARLYRDAGPAWPDYRDEVVERLATSPRDAVLFALLSLEDVRFAWSLAHSLPLQSADVCGTTRPGV
jgi:tetratricopeptide (TPR) repeat protein